jgi:hypothetical protein
MLTNRPFPSTVFTDIFTNIPGPFPRGARDEFIALINMGLLIQLLTTTHLIFSRDSLKTAAGFTELPGPPPTSGNTQIPMEPFWGNSLVRYERHPGFTIGKNSTHYFKNFIAVNKFLEILSPHIKTSFPGSEIKIIPKG